ncbi:MAG: bifunctional precorrin-2 dehydrogenase/sirohydrochlorin ferrochelatase [Tannerella sp.]|jgi:siroheme synthase-like protein|nr:bifunctional precorrin-2 dehydrogenase/sirohydrochlorin ferrochelatase [Tannerella sp.]
MFLPISINITGKRILIIGGGKVGFHKATVLSRFTDKATVISTRFHDGFDRLPFELVNKEYAPSDLCGAYIIYICTENEALNARIKRDAEMAGVLASVCDNPQLCDFISPAIHKQGNISIAVSSNAQNVRQSIAVRDRIAQLCNDEIISLK